MSRTPEGAPSLHAGAYLLTAHGRLVCAHPATGKLVQRSAAKAGSSAITLPLGDFRGGVDRFLAGEPSPLSVPLTEGALAGFTATLAGNRRTLTLSRDGRFLTAERDSETIAHDRAEAMAWETFLPLTRGDLELLLGIAGNDWVLRDGGTLVRRADVSLGGVFSLRLGAALQADLRYQLPFEGRALPYRMTLLREGWRISEACLFRPAIALAAFAMPARLEQLYLSLRSLAEVARFDGHILVLTDQTRETVLRRVPALDPARLTVETIAPADEAARIVARYAVLDWREAKRFQPILLASPDFLFDADPTPMLGAIAASQRITARVEPAALLGASPNMGTTLLQQDMLPTRHVVGFGADLLGVPNIVEHRDELALIRRVIINRAHLFGRQDAEWQETETVNYVSARTLPFDTQILAGYCRDWQSEADRGTRVGLVRFARAGGPTQALDAMERHLRALLGAPEPIAAAAASRLGPIGPAL